MVLVSDFDLTFFTDDYENNIKLVNDFVDQGNIFIIATGRNITDLMKDINNYYIKCSYFICNDGATIFDQFLNVIYRKDIDSEVVKPICKILDNNNYITNVYIDTSTGFVEDYNRSANKIVGHYLNRLEAKKVVDYINNKYDKIDSYLSRNWINIGNKQNSKGTAIEFLIKYYNFDRQKIYTIGNDINDISLSNFENSYIISDADPLLKKDFGYSVDTFEELINILSK